MSGEFLLFGDPEPSGSGRTLRWEVIARFGHVTLGWVSWHAQWRCYAFHPEARMVFEQDCLRKLANFCEAKTREHRERARERRSAAAGWPESWGPA